MMEPPQEHTPLKQKHNQEYSSRWVRTFKREPNQWHLNNQFTNKKYQYNDYGHPFDGHQRYTNKQLAQIRLKQCLEDSRYSEASQQIKNIRYLKQKQKKMRIRTMSAEHSREKAYICQAHLNQMSGFRRAWDEVFEKFRLYQQDKKNQLRHKNQIQLQRCRQSIMRRCRSARPSAKMSKINELEAYERSLRKRGKTGELRLIKQEKQHLKIQCQRQQQKLYNKIILQQQNKYEERQAKRYHSFMLKVKETKKDHERLYKRQQQRLKQKFKNIMRNLEHQHKVQMNTLLCGKII